MRRIFLLAIAAVLSGTAAFADTSTIQFDGHDFKIAGWRAAAMPQGGWGQVFDVYAGVKTTQAMLGTYTVANGALVFHPTFPIAPGVKYRAVFHAPGSASGQSTIEQLFDGPHVDQTPTAHVVNVYPSGDVLPSNQLRLYIYFSGAMSRGEAADHVRILDEHGESLAGKHALFLPGEELWDPNDDRLTLTFDPGRIKRGLTSNQTIGPPIADGKRYTLIIDREWPDAHGVPMTAEFRKMFRGSPAVRTPPDPKTWRVSAPKAGTSAPLIVDFPEAMNYTLLQRMITVEDSHGKIGGDVTVENHESEWRFTPRGPWKPGMDRLVIDTGLEDLAGNHIGQAFDIDTFDHVTEHITSNTVTLPFAVR